MALNTVPCLHEHGERVCDQSNVRYIKKYVKITLNPLATVHLKQFTEDWTVWYSKNGTQYRTWVCALATRVQFQRRVALTMMRYQVRKC